MAASGLAFAFLRSSASTLRCTLRCFPVVFDVSAFVFVNMDCLLCWRDNACGAKRFSSGASGTISARALHFFAGPKCIGAASSGYATSTTTCDCIQVMQAGTIKWRARGSLALGSRRVIRAPRFSQVNLKNANETGRLERDGNGPCRFWPEKPLKHSCTESFALDCRDRRAVQLAPFYSNVLPLLLPACYPGDRDGSLLARKCSVFDCVGGQFMETQ